MKKVRVFYEGWGERWWLGTLADDGRELLFEYSPRALAEGLSLSPRHLPLQTPAMGRFPVHQWRLPGLFADSLPDGWGLLLMDRLFRQQGLRPEQCSPLDRLSFIGARGLGALTYEPASQDPMGEAAIDLAALAEQAERVLQGQDTHTLQTLAMLGGSPQGARPKVLVYYNPLTAQMSTQPMAQGAPWLVKFQALGEHKEVCAIEAFYAQLARVCGLEVPGTRVFDLGPKRAAFGIERFDVSNGLRVPVHSLAGVLHVDFRVPSSVDYVTFLRATRMMTRDEREVRKAYERVVFNVLFHNRDDHAKNLAYRMNAQRQWQLAPAYDLTFSHGPGGEHHMDICGEGLRPLRQHLTRLASEGGLDLPWAMNRLDEMLAVVEGWQDWIEPFEIRQITRQRLHKVVQAQRRALMA